MLMKNGLCHIDTFRVLHKVSCATKIANMASSKFGLTHSIHKTIEEILHSHHAGLQWLLHAPRIKKITHTQMDDKIK